jgi:hypothetical protein
MELAENFFSQKSVIARKRSVTPFFWAKRPLSPPPKKPASAAKPILACLYKTLTMGARRSCGKFVLYVRGSGIKIGEKKLLQMPFLELYHVYIYYMTSHIHFCGKIPTTARVIWLTVPSWCLLTKRPT